MVDENLRLHSTDAPAIAFSDHESFYALHGVMIPSDVIEDPASLTTKRIETESNLEVRRVFIEVYGVPRFLKDSGAQKIHKDKFGILYRKDLSGEEPLVMVEVANSTPEPDGKIKHYFLRVPPHIQTAREAVAWTFDLTPDDYQPERET